MARVQTYICFSFSLFFFSQTKHQPKQVLYIPRRTHAHSEWVRWSAVCSWKQKNITYRSVWSEKNTTPDFYIDLIVILSNFQSRLCR